MKREIWINSYPDTIGGAATESLHFCALARARDVDVHLVPNHKLVPAVQDWCESIGIKIHQYHPGIFAGKIVAGWCHLPLLTALYEWHIPPRCSIFFNSMTSVDAPQRACHRDGYIDRWGFVSDYQRKMLLMELDPIRPVKEFVGYKPYFDPKHPLQGVKFEYREPIGHFVIGRISRDDPTKFSGDTWDLFERVNTGYLRKHVCIMGFGPNCQKAMGLPCASPFAWEMRPPGFKPTAEFYGWLQCLIHKTGGSRESYGRFVVEAACAGVPVVVEKDYAFPELIIDRETGFLCSSSDEMVEVASMLARDEPTRNRIIYAAYDHVTKNLIDADKCWEPWEKLLQEFA